MQFSDPTHASLNAMLTVRGEIQTESKRPQAVSGSPSEDSSGESCTISRNLA
jgi:hypothetical protein